MFHSTSPYTTNSYYELDSSISLFDTTTTNNLHSYSTYSTSLPSYDSTYMHRSNSTQSFTNNQAGNFIVDPTSNLFFTSSSTSSASDFIDFHNEPVRRVFSTGDLDQATTENCLQESAGPNGRVGRYSAEERMKRIEKYRYKRNQRNFQKKITYACRKTLADSRPRVRGRFARNGEAEAEGETSEISYETNMNQIHNSFENYNGGGNGSDQWWRQMQALLTEEEEGCCYLEDHFFSTDNAFSVNLLS